MSIELIQTSRAKVMPNTNKILNCLLKHTSSALRRFSVTFFRRKQFTTAEVAVVRVTVLISVPVPVQQQQSGTFSSIGILMSLLKVSAVRKSWEHAELA